MPKHQKIITRVFSEFDESKIKKFINTSGQGTISELLERYKNEYSSIKERIEKISKIEEVIIQLRCRNAVETEVKLAITREYIYARTLFFRRDKDINDIRVMIGKTDQYGDDQDKLLENTDFKQMCVNALTHVIDNTIESNLNELGIKL